MDAKTTHIEICSLTAESDRQPLLVLTKQFLDTFAEIEPTTIPFLESYYQSVVDGLHAAPEKYLEPIGGCLLAKIGDKFVGTATLQPYKENESELKRVFVLPEYRGQGIAKLLVTRVLELAKLYGYTGLRLDSSERHVIAHKMYEKLGFEYTIPYQPVHPLLEGKMIFMYKDLKAS